MNLIQNNEQVLRFLDSITPMEEGLRKYLDDNLRTMKPAKGTYLVKEGEVARNIGFIEQGVVRGFRTAKNGIEKTNWFVREKDVVISIRSFFLQEPASETVQTLEPCIIRYLTFPQLKDVLARYKLFHEHRAELLQKYYLLSEEREEMRQQARYDRVCYLMTHYSDIIDRVPDKLLASFIHTSPQYFSKLKGKYKGR